MQKPQSKIFFFSVKWTKGYIQEVFNGLQKAILTQVSMSLSLEEGIKLGIHEVILVQTYGNQ